MKKTQYRRWCACALACSDENAYRRLKIYGMKTSRAEPRSFNCKAIRSPPVISNSKANHNKHNHRRAIKSLSTPQASFPWAVLSLVPVPRGLLKPSQWRGCYSYCQKLSRISLLSSKSQSSFVSEQVRNRTPTAIGEGQIKAVSNFLSVPRLWTPWDNHYLCSVKLKS